MDGLYRDLMAHRCHQDRLMWSRIQTFSVLQLAAFTASWTVLAHSRLAAGIMVIALLLTALVYALVWKDAKDAVVNQNLMDELALRIVSAITPPLQSVVGQKRPVSFTSAERIPILGSGRNVVRLAFVVFIAADLVMFFASLSPWLRCAT